MTFDMTQKPDMTKEKLDLSVKRQSRAKECPLLSILTKPKQPHPYGGCVLPEEFVKVKLPASMIKSLMC